MPAGRPKKYDDKTPLEWKELIDEYCDSTVDEDKQVVKQANSEKGYEMYDNKLVVNLPTIEGLSQFLGLSKQRLYEWEKEHDEFRDALEWIRQEQKKRLINMGLAGEYNSTIAKLILSANHGMAEKKETDLTSKGEQLQPLLVQFIDADNNEDSD